VDPDSDSDPDTQHWSPTTTWKFNVFFLRFLCVQEITLWRKGERVRKLPLGGSLYQQQQHALARHQPGEQPVRTAPTPSLPPTPCLIDTAESRLPGAAAAEPKAEEAAGEVEQSCDPVSGAFLTLGFGSGIRCFGIR
jgi:hypothetical protein